MKPTRITTIRANAETIRALSQAIHETFSRRDVSERDWQAWQQACHIFHEQYNALFYPGGEAALQALKRCEPKGIDIALDFLEADPMFFRSGYQKEWIWKRLAICSLTAAQLSRVERIALAYTDRRITRDFWYMCRAMARIGSLKFWNDVRALMNSAPPRGIRARYLSAYENGTAEGEQIHRRVAISHLPHYFD